MYSYLSAHRLFRNFGIASPAEVAAAALQAEAEVLEGEIAAEKVAAVAKEAQSSELFKVAAL